MAFFCLNSVSYHSLLSNINCHLDTPVLFHNVINVSMPLCRLLILLKPCPMMTKGVRRACYHCKGLHSPKRLRTSAVSLTTQENIGSYLFWKAFVTVCYHEVLQGRTVESLSAMVCHIKGMPLLPRNIPISKFACRLSVGL